MQQTSLADKDLLIGEMQENLTQSLATAAEWDKERPKVATMTWELRHSQLRNEQFERQVISLQVTIRWVTLYILPVEVSNTFHSIGVPRANEIQAERKGGRGKYYTGI